MEKKKHILFISSWFPNRTNPTHGIFNLYFARAVAIYNKVSVIHVNSDETLNSEFETLVSHEENITTYHIYYKKVRSTFPGYSQLKKRNKVISAFELAYNRLITEQGKPDLIHLNVILPMGIGAYHLVKKYNLPLVINENWSGYCEEDGNYKGYFKKMYTEKIVAAASAILPTSHYLEKAMLSHKLNGNYTVVPNVVNVNVFKPSGKPSEFPIRFIHISSLNDREKNVSGILNAFAKAHKQNTNIELSIVGEGVDKLLYENFVTKFGLSNSVFFKGRLMSEDLVKEINKSHALIMFSNYETFCLVIIEAFACGKPVITSNAGAIPDYMKPELGILVHKNAEDELCSAILEMAKNASTYNPNLIRDFAIQNYSYEKVGSDLKRIYDSVITNTKLKN